MALLQDRELTGPANFGDFASEVFANSRQFSEGLLLRDQIGGTSRECSYDP